MISTTNRSQSCGARVRWSCGCVFFAMIALGLVASPAVAKYGGGTGSEAYPYLIRTAEDLAAIGVNSTDWDKHFKLVADVDLQGYDEKNLTLIGRWVVLGDSGNKPFSGIFDGNGRTIANFTYNGGKQDNVGLFRYVEPGQIKNLRLTNAKVSSDGLGIGSLVGYAKNSALADCHVADVHVTGNTRVGGLAGSIEGWVSQCSSRGSVTGVRFVGGLVGDVGQGTVARSYSKAAVSGQEEVGGLVGATLYETTLIDSCYATGSVNGTTYVGGLIGQVAQGRVFQSYSTGAVRGIAYVGGLVGSKKVLGDVIASYWDVQTSGQATSAAGTAKTTAELRLAETFVNWDFAGTWAICEGTSSPIFWWQVPVADLRCPDGVNATDFAWFAMQWRRRDCGQVNSHCTWTDFDRSGSVDSLDLAILAEYWLAGID